MQRFISTLLMLFFLVLAGCEQVDVDQLSDEDIQRISDQVIVCESPYIRHGAGCCLDTNQNSICDNDEIQKDTKISTTEPGIGDESSKPGNPEAIEPAPEVVEGVVDPAASEPAETSNQSHQQTEPSEDCFAPMQNGFFVDTDGDGCHSGVDADCGGVEGVDDLRVTCFDGIDSDCDGLVDGDDDDGSCDAVVDSYTQPAEESSTPIYDSDLTVPSWPLNKLCATVEDCDDGNTLTRDYCPEIGTPRYCHYFEECGVRYCSGGEYCVQGLCRKDPRIHDHNLTVAFILVEFSDSLDTQMSPDIFQNRYVPRLRSYWEQVSDNQVSFLRTDTFDWVSLDTPCTYMNWDDERLLSVVDAFPQSYNKVVFVFNTHCGGGGQASPQYGVVGFQESDLILNPDVQQWDLLDQTLNHEFGHMLGLDHSGMLWQCQAGQGDCVFDNYGNYFDIMGDGGTYAVGALDGELLIYPTPLAVNAAQKYRKGWLDADVLKISAPGTYAIGSSQNMFGKPRAALISINEEFYFLEWKEYDGVDSWTDPVLQENNQGLFVNVIHSNAAQQVSSAVYWDSVLLDMKSDGDAAMDRVFVTLDESQTASLPGFELHSYGKINNELIFSVTFT